MLAASPAASAKTHRFAPATEVRVSFEAPKGKATGTLLRFARNRVSLSRNRHGTLTLHAPGKRPRRVVSRRQHGKRVVVSLSAITMRTKVSVRQRAAALTGAFVPEIAVVTSRRHRLVGLRITTAVRPLSAAAAPAAPPIGLPPALSSRLFAPDSVWNAPLPANATLDPSNATLVAALTATVAQNQAAGWGPWIETGQSPTLYTVPAAQPTVPVHLDPGSWKTGLQQVFNAVPIPTNAQPGPGTDAQMTIWQPSTDRLWEFWQARKTADGWRANFGGAMSNVSRSPGYYDANSWPGLSQSSWGATATSLPVVAGTMSIGELQSGVIPHALAMNIPEARAKSYSLPAQRTDGASTAANSIPEGARFRLDPRLDIDALNLPPVTRAMAIAAQRYGIIVRDVTHHAISFFAENPISSGVDQYTALYGSPYPTSVMKAFPWSHLQLLKMTLRSSP